MECNYRCCVLVGQMQTALLEIRGGFTVLNLLSESLNLTEQTNSVLTVYSSSARS